VLKALAQFSFLLGRQVLPASERVSIRLRGKFAGAHGLTGRGGTSEEDCDPNKTECLRKGLHFSVSLFWVGAVVREFVLACSASLSR
jgi:hypothetical protein